MRSSKARLAQKIENMKKNKRERGKERREEKLIKVQIFVSVVELLILWR